MKFFLDSANLSEIKEASELGLLDGVTTNPSLVAKENKQKDFKTTIKEICKIVKGPVSAEVISTDFKSMKKEASFFIDLKSVEITSALTGPFTILHISLMVVLKSFCLFSFATKEGFVVTPSRSPNSDASLISLKLALSRKNFIF